MHYTVVCSLPMFVSLIRCRTPPDVSRVMDNVSVLVSGEIERYIANKTFSMTDFIISH